jgi:hypothetical protein
MLSVVIVAPVSTIATMPSRGADNPSASSEKAFSMAKASTSMTLAVKPPSSSAETRASTFSVREAASSTCTIFRVARHGPQHLEVEVHFLDRVRDVVDGLELDLGFQVVLVQVRRHRDDLGDHRRPRHGRRGMPRAGPGAGDRPLDGLADGLDLDDVLFHHRVGRQRFDRVVLDAVAIPGTGELQQLHGGRADVDANQRRLTICDQSHDFSPIHGRLRALRAPVH